MTPEDPQQEQATPGPDVPGTPTVETATPRRPRRWLSHLGRGARLFLLILVALVAGTLVGLLLLDIGPSLKPLAEQQASRLIQRPVHIGSLSVNLVRGRFVFTDFLIENLDAGQVPFFQAKRITVGVPWWTILIRREIIVESLTLSDWRMRVETFAGGGHNFIKIPQRAPSTGPRRFVTTVQLVRAERGEFTYLDHGAPWSVVARNLDFTIARLRDYRGEARFRDATIQIQKFEPMSANMYCTFRIYGSRLELDRIDLEADGSRSAVTGTVNMARWPEQTYQVRSVVQFPRMREIFFASNRFTLSGEGTFDGTFKLFKGGRDLTGRFESREAGINAWRFPMLRGSLRWLPERFEVTDATSMFYGGRLRLAYEMAPLGRPDQPAIARLDTTYDGVSLGDLTDFLDRPVLRLSGLASGHNLLEWPLGRFRDHRGRGRIEASPPAGRVLMTRAVPVPDHDETVGLEVGPFNPAPLQGYLPIGGQVTYEYEPEWIEVAPSVVATEKTYVSFEGRTAWGERSLMPFHVSSADWQESDRFLAAIISAVASPTRAIPVGGYGEFDGVMTGAFTAPRVEGRFTGDRMRAWNVTWGRATGDVTIVNGYAHVRKTRITRGQAQMEVEGKFSLGYPRRDRGEELDARVQMRRWPLVDLRHAFELDDYPVTAFTSGEFHLYDKYQEPQGFGRLTLDEIVAYDEPMETATAGLRFEGNGVRLDAIQGKKGDGTVTGAAFVGWDGTYSFNANGRQIGVEHVAAFTYPGVPLSGTISFTASGSGLFESPRYEVRGRIDDLFLRDEGVGQVTGRLLVRDESMTIDQLEVASARLAISGTGRVSMTPESDGEILLRFQDTSLDPYARVFRPQISPFTTAVASGTLRIFGELATPERTRAEVVLSRASLNLYDYVVRNDGDVRLSLNDQILQVDRLRLVGDGTALDVSGDVRLAEERIALRALGDANLGILQGLLRDIRSSGAAELQAEVRGTFDAPTVLGSLVVSNGRLRHFAFPHSLDTVNGRVDFDAGGVEVGLAGRIGGGDVQVNGRLGFRGLTPTEYNVTAVGEGMRLRYPEGFRSLVDADLALRGNFFSPLLTGTVNVRNATLERTFDTGGTGLFGFAAVGVGGRGPAVTTPSRIPVRYDVRLLAPSTLRVENRDARLVSSAELTLRGTYDQPLLFGRVDIERGEVFFEGNRYQVTSGTVDFINPTRIEPLFDIEAETRARVPGQIYRVVSRVSGTPDRFTFDLSSDPPLATVDILSLLFGDVRDPQNAEVRALRSPELAQQELLRARAARLLASPISSNVGRVVEEAIGVDTVQITPMLSDLSAQESSRITPSARLTVGKRISERLYLTYSRALNASTRDEIILLEFTQSDRFSWVVSQNEDRTYAVDVRVRRVF